MQNAPDGAGAFAKENADDTDAVCISKSLRPAQELIASIDTRHAQQVRVFRARWRNQHRIELRPYSATVPGVYMPCGAGISVPIEKLPELIAALKRVRP
jgi:hypothetical protein